MGNLTRRDICAAGIGGLLLSVFAAKTALGASGSGKTTVRLASTKVASRLDPHIDVKWEVLMVLSAVYDTLVYQDSSGKIIPGLAMEWRILNDGRTYEFDLREGVRFHDGAPFNAEAVKYNFDRIAKLGPKSLKAASLIADVTSVEVVSPRKVRINLGKPSGDFLFNLSLTFLGMVSPAAADRWGDEYHMHQSGTGPYKFSEYKIGEKYTLVRNVDYAWGPASFGHEGPALVDELEWRFLPEPSSRSVALLAGDFDVVFDLPPTSVKRVTSSSDYDVVFSQLRGQTAYWFLNTRKAPTDDPAVRQALLYGVDIESGVKSISRGSANRAHGPISKVTPEYATDLDKTYPFDRKKALALLEAAGWIDTDGDGIREKNGQKLVISVEMASWGNSEPYSTYLQSQLKEMGIKADLEMMEFSVGIQAGKNGDKNLLFTGGSGFSAEDSLAPYFLSKYADEGFAFSKYKDSKLDEILESAKVTVDDERRRSLYQEAQKYIMEKALILPIYDYSEPIGISKKIKNLNFGLTGLTPDAHDLSI